MLERLFRYLTAKLVFVGGVFIVVQAFLLPCNESAIAWVRFQQKAIPLLLFADLAIGCSQRILNGRWPFRRWAWLVLASAPFYPFMLSPFLGPFWTNGYLFWVCWAMVPAAVGLLLGVPMPKQRNLGFLGIVLLLGFCGLEFTLRHVPGAPYTYLEQNTGRAFSPNDKAQDSLYYAPFRLQTLPREWLAKRGRLRNREFEQTITYNRWGFNDAEWPDSADGKTELWLALGDSFTEGAGAGPTGADNWPRFLQKKLSQHNPGLRILNGGMNGADPVLSLNVMQQLTPRFKPRKVLLALNSSDVDEIIARGGLNRHFLNFHILPFEYGMITSFVFRYYFIKVRKYDFQGNSPQELAYLKSSSLITLQEIINRMEQWGNEHEMEVYCFYIPNFQEMRDTTLKPTALSGLHGVLDLRPCYVEKGVSQNPEQYYWPIDRHHTPKGYKLLADCIAEQVQIARSKRDPVVTQHLATER